MATSQECYKRSTESQAPLSLMFSTTKPPEIWLWPLCYRKHLVMFALRLFCLFLPNFSTSFLTSWLIQKNTKFFSLCSLELFISFLLLLSSYRLTHKHFQKAKKSSIKQDTLSLGGTSISLCIYLYIYMSLSIYLSIYIFSSPWPMLNCKCVKSSTE